MLPSLRFCSESCYMEKTGPRNPFSSQPLSPLIGAGRMASASHTYRMHWAPRNFMVAWAVPSSFPLLAIFKTWDSFRAGQWPSDRSSLACRLPVPHHRGVQEPALPPSLIGFLPRPCCGPVGWGSGSSCGPTPYSPITCSSLQTTLGPNSRSHLFTPSAVQRCPPLPRALTLFKTSF